MDSHRGRIYRSRGLRDLGHPTVESRMAKQTPPHDNSAHVKSKYLNVLLWVVIALVVVLIGAWTIWASRQPDLHSVWVPD
jgi:hypothetical protein